MALVDLRPLWRRLAKEAMRGASARLRQRRGVDGRLLPDKRRPNGRPLGFGRSRGGVPGYLAKGRVRVFLAGFVVGYSGEPKVGWFHRGFPPGGRPPRPVVGIPEKQRRDFLGRATREAARQLERAIRKAR